MFVIFNNLHFVRKYLLLELIIRYLMFYGFDIAFPYQL